jgi:hypothetical protein
VASEKFRPILSERDWFELGVTRLVRSPWLTFTNPYKEARLRGRVVERDMMAIASS